MPIIQIIAILILIGVILWIANGFLPMDGRIKQIMNAAVIIAVVLWLLSLFVPGLSHMRIGLP